MRKTTIWLLVLLTFACLAGSARMWRWAFPISNIEFRMTREEAQKELQQILQQHFQQPLTAYQRAITFGEDDSTKHFLELEYGLQELEKRTRGGLNVWYWSGRWFRPGQHEEFSAQLDPQGHLVGLYRKLEEERPAGSLDLPAARTLAESFLQRYVRHHPSEKLEFRDESHQQLPHRVDRTFVWERQDLRLGSARYRLEVEVQGDAVGAYLEYLQLPESWDT